MERQERSGTDGCTLPWTSGRTSAKQGEEPSCTVLYITVVTFATVHIPYHRLNGYPLNYMT